MCAEPSTTTSASRLMHTKGQRAAYTLLLQDPRLDAKAREVIREYLRNSIALVRMLERR